MSDGERSMLRHFLGALAVRKRLSATRRRTLIPSNPVGKCARRANLCAT
jgi:hypothetical protein